MNNITLTEEVTCRSCNEQVDIDLTLCHTTEDGERSYFCVECIDNAISRGE